MATYKGTKITGTSTTAKVFKHSGVKKAKKGQTYHNTSVGHNYKCTKAGEPKEAKWKYVDTSIIKKPGLAVQNLAAPSRSNYNMTATWKIPGDLVDKKQCNRATSLDITWTLDFASGKDPKKVVHQKNEKATSSAIDLNNLKIGSTTYTRASFYPRSTVKLNSVSVQVVPKNGKGKGKAASQSRRFGLPRVPSISGFSFNSENGVISCTVDTDAGSDYNERYDTVYKMTITDTRTGKTWNQYNSSSTSTSISLSYNVSDYQQLSFSQYVKVYVEAYARGFVGDSAKTSRTAYVAYPGKVSVQGVDVTGKTGSDKCTVRVKTNSTTEHPVDQVRLEFLADCEYRKKESIPGSESWTDSDIIDDANCTALSIPVSSILPSKGKYTWIRVKSWHYNENVLFRLSEYVRVTALETPAPTAADDDITIIAVSPGADGESIVVILGWNADGQDDSDGTELTWSEEEDTWKSTKAPEIHTFSWSDGPRTVGSVTYRDSATITIKGLEQGTKYYVKARRFMEGEKTTYSDYSNTETAITSETPESIVASCDRYVPEGKSLPVYWTFSGNGVQKKWQIVDSEGAVVVNGEDTITSTQISAERLEAMAVNNNLTFTVQVSTGGAFVVSEQQTVTIVDNPSLTLTAPASLTAQPYSFNVESNRLCDLIVIVTSQGAVGQFPDGIKRQTTGDTIFSDVFTPTWAENDSTFTATVQLPPALDFWDLGKYTVAVTARDRTTNLLSDEKTANFSVAWAHQASDIRPTTIYSASADTSVDDDKTYYVYEQATESYIPVDPEGNENPSVEGWLESTITNYVTLTPIDTTDATGYHRLAVEISLVPPPGSAETDLYDIYRLTGDGAILIGESFPLTVTTTDEYAPFGEDMTLNYRIAIRTVDGDVSFADFEYVQDSSNLRFDWATGSVEFPYNLSIGDAYKKDVEFRSHLDGGIDGYWNQNIERNGKLSTDVIRLEQQEDIDKTRALARYAGPVFVRTPEGTAYEADVQVSDMSGTNNKIMAIAIDATEVSVTDEFLLPTPYRMEEEGD